MSSTEPSPRNNDHHVINDNDFDFTTYVHHYQRKYYDHLSQLRASHQRGDNHHVYDWADDDDWPNDDDLWHHHDDDRDHHDDGCIFNHHHGGPCYVNINDDDPDDGAIRPADPD